MCGKGPCSPPHIRERQILLGKCTQSVQALFLVSPTPPVRTTNLVIYESFWCLLGTRGVGREAPLPPPSPPLGVSGGLPPPSARPPPSRLPCRPWPLPPTACQTRRPTALQIRRPTATAPPPRWRRRRRHRRRPRPPKPPHAVLPRPFVLVLPPSGWGCPLHRR